MTEGNGSKVRPDLQTKLIGGFIGTVFLAAIVWVGATVSSMSERVTRIEEKILSRANMVDYRLERIEDKVDNLTEKINGR